MLKADQKAAGELNIFKPGDSLYQIASTFGTTPEKSGGFWLLYVTSGLPTPSWSLDILFGYELLFFLMR